MELLAGRVARTRPPLFFFHFTDESVAQEERLLEVELRNRYLFSTVMALQTSTDSIRETPAGCQQDQGIRYPELLLHFPIARS